MKRRTSVSVDEAKAQLATDLVGVDNFSYVVEEALDLLIDRYHAERDLGLYRMFPLTAEERATAPAPADRS